VAAKSLAFPERHLEFSGIIKTRAVADLPKLISRDRSETSLLFHVFAASRTCVYVYARYNFYTRIKFNEFESNQWSRFLMRD